LVNQVVADGESLNEALKLANKLSKGAGVAIGFDKFLVNRGIELELVDALEMEMQYVEKVFETEDLREGLDAFINKREPVFKNQ
jgi:enoyl-CoA hydratase